jgi:segregation and condensation protein A
MQRYELEINAPKHVIVQFPYTIEGQRDYIRSQLFLSGRLSFSDLIHAFPEKIAVVFNFLAILEMIQLQEIEVVIGEGYNNFWIKTKDGNSSAEMVSTD